MGAFEEDDEDIYSREDMNEYDFALEDEKTKKTQLQITAKGCLDGFIQAKAKVIFFRMKRFIYLFFSLGYKKAVSAAGDSCGISR